MSQPNSCSIEDANVNFGGKPVPNGGLGPGLVLRRQGSFDGLESIPPCNFGNISEIMTKSIENAFYRLGELTGRHPWTVILISLITCGICASGMGLWVTITDDEMLWTPYGSPFIEEKKWIENNFPRDTRTETVILSSEENVLTASHMQYLNKVINKVANCRTSDDKYGFLDLCIRNPASRNNCLVESVLKIWNYDDDVIANLTDASVLTDITNALNGSDDDLASSVSALLSNLTLDSVSGDVVSSEAMMAVWLLKDNSTKVEGQASNDPVARDWELAFIDVVVGEAVPEGLPLGSKMEGVAQRSFDDEIDGAVASNMAVLAIGCSLIFLYIALVLGKFNWIEQRILLSIMGVVVIGLAIFASFGLCFYLQLFFADMHPIIPFLLLGIGVDDMFVIVQSLENLPKSQKSLPIPQRIGMTMKHAGVSITVTSLTDMMAFLIGASSRLPILRHFCFFCAMGVLFLYFFAVTFFVGCLCLDERRIDAKKPCPCLRSRGDLWRPNKFSQNDLGKIFFDKYVAKYLFKTPVKILVLVSTLALFGVGAYGSSQMEIDYNPVWYMRESSYQQQFYISMTKYFPDNGEKVQVFYGDIQYWNHLDDMMESYQVIQNSSYLKNDSIHFWFPDFYSKFCNQTVEEMEDEFDAFDNFIGGDFEDKAPGCQDEKYFKVSILLFLNESRQFGPDFKFNRSLEDAPVTDLLNGAFEITASRATFQHGYLPNTTIQNIAMDEIKASMSTVRFYGEDFATPIVYSFMYVQWDANKLISKELVRNLSLTFATVMVVTLVLVANLRVSVLVLACVVFTVVNCCGYAHFMGLTIEIVTSILLILSCGLALDYAAHIGVAYVCSRQTQRQDRAHDSLVSMGSAVFHGGFSTFTAFALLITSDSYIFTTFFKMFATVVLFGLFHGLVFLPVILSMIGPQLQIVKSEMNSTATTKTDLGLSPIQMNGKQQPEDSPKSQTKFELNH